MQIMEFSSLSLIPSLHNLLSMWTSENYQVFLSEIFDISIKIFLEKEWTPQPILIHSHALPFSHLMATYGPQKVDVSFFQIWLADPWVSAKILPCVIWNCVKSEAHHLYSTCCCIESTSWTRPDLKPRHGHGLQLSMAQSRCSLMVLTRFVPAPY